MKMKIINFFKGLIQYNNIELSSMRFCMLYIILLLGIAIFLIDISVIYSIIKDTMNGYEIATIIGANSTLLFSVIYGKYQQTKVENNSNDINKLDV